MHTRLVVAKRHIITNNKTELGLEVGFFWDLWNWTAEQICKWQFIQELFSLIHTEDLNKGSLGCNLEISLCLKRDSWLISISGQKKCQYPFCSSDCLCECVSIDCVQGKNLVNIERSFAVLEQPSPKLYLCHCNRKRWSILCECLSFFECSQEKKKKKAEHPKLCIFSIFIIGDFW